MNVGSLIAYLDLDDSNFDRKTKSANKQIDGLALNMEALGKLNPELKLKTDEAARKAQALKVRLAELKVAMASAEDPHEIRVETSVTMMKLAAVKAEMRALHVEAAKPIKISVDQSSLSKLSNDLDGLSKKMKGVGSGGLFGTAMAFGPALAPFGGAAVGALGAITAGAVEAVSAVGVLALALKGVAGANTAYSAFQTAQASANNSYQQALAAAAGKSGKARTSAIASANQTHSKALGTAQFNLNQSAYGKSSAATQQFVKFDQTQLKPFGAGLMSSAQAGVLPGLTAGLQSFIKDAPQVDGAIRIIGTSVGNLMAEAGHALNSPFWKQWITWFGKDSAKNVGTMGHSVGQLVEALARMDQRSGGAGKLVGDVDRLSTRLNKWSASPAFLTFLETIRKDEAQTSKFLKALWMDLNPILKGLSATGGAEMQLLTGALDTISHLPTGWLDAFGRAIPFFFAFKLMSGPIGAVSTALSGATKAMAGFAEAGSIEKMSMLRSGFQTAMKGLSGAAGIGLLVDGLSRGSSALGQMESIAGTTAAGFAAGGPLGAGLGFVGSSLHVLWQDLNDAGTAARTNYAEIGKTQAISDAKANVDALAASLDQVTGAYTNATKAAILNELQSPKNPDGSTNVSGPALLKVAADHGIGQRQVVAAIQGDPTATKALNGVLPTQGGIDAANAKLAALKTAYHYASEGHGLADAERSDPHLAAQLKGVDTSSGNSVKAALTAQGALVESLTNTRTALGQYANGLTAAQVKVRNTAIATGSLTDILMQSSDQLKSWPKQLLTKVSAVGTAQTMQGLLGIVDAAHKMGMKNLSSGQALAEATIMVNADPDIAHTKKNIDDLAAALRGLPSPTVTVNADTSQAMAALRALTQVAPGLSSLGISLGTPKPKVGHNAAGTNFWGGGLTWLDEQGPELVNLPRGSQVIPHAKSMAMVNQSSHGFGTGGRIHPSDIDAIGKAMAYHAAGAARNALTNELMGQGG